MSYLVNLDKFYGPLDLLLYLLEKEEMDIYDIPIAVITDQYLDFLETNQLMDLDNIGEFLIMASYLLNLKSRMLLPGIWPQSPVENEEEDPREELVQRILEYRQFKLAGQYLADRYDQVPGKVFFRDGQPGPGEYKPDINSNIGMLVRAWQAVLERNSRETSYQLPDDDIDVSLKMDIILERLPRNGTKIIFQQFFTADSGRREYLAFFLALLELMRMRKVGAAQEQGLGNINIWLQTGYDGC